MDSSDMSRPEMRQARSNFPESPDSAAGCQNFFPRGSFGLPEPGAAAEGLDGRINKQGERGNGEKLQGHSGISTCCPLSPVGDALGSCALPRARLCPFPVLPVPVLLLEGGSSAGNGAQGARARQGTPSAGKRASKPSPKARAGLHQGFLARGNEIPVLEPWQGSGCPFPAHARCWAGLTCPALSTCAGRAGAGLGTVLAGQSHPPCPHELQKCLLASVLGFRTCCKLNSGVSARETLPALCSLLLLSSHNLRPGFCPPGWWCQTLRFPTAFPGRFLAPRGHKPVLLLPPALNPCPHSLSSDCSSRQSLVNAGKALLEQRGSCRARP